MRLPKVRFGRYNGFCVVFPRVGGGEGREMRGEEGEGNVEGVGDEGDGKVGREWREKGNGEEDEDEEGLEVMVGLEKGAMERLKEMEMWNRFGRWRSE